MAWRGIRFNWESMALFTEHPACCIVQAEQRKSWYKSGELKGRVSRDGKQLAPQVSRVLWNLRSAQSVRGWRGGEEQRAHNSEKREKRLRLCFSGPPTLLASRRRDHAALTDVFLSSSGKNALTRRAQGGTCLITCRSVRELRQDTKVPARLQPHAPVWLRGSGHPQTWRVSFSACLPGHCDELRTRLTVGTESDLTACKILNIWWNIFFGFGCRHELHVELSLKCLCILQDVSSQWPN